MHGKASRKKKQKPISSHLFSEETCKRRNKPTKNYPPITADEFLVNYYDPIQDRTEKLVKKWGTPEAIIDIIKLKNDFQELNDLDFKIQTLQAENNQLRYTASTCSQIMNTEYLKEEIEDEINDLNQPLPPKKLRNPRMLPPPQSLKIPASALPQVQPPIGTFSSGSEEQRKLSQLERQVQEQTDLVQRLESELMSVEQRIRVLRRK